MPKPTRKSPRKSKTKRKPSLRQSVEALAQIAEKHLATMPVEEQEERIAALQARQHSHAPGRLSAKHKLEAEVARLQDTIHGLHLRLELEQNNAHDIEERAERYREALVENNTEIERLRLKTKTLELLLKFWEKQLEFNEERALVEANLMPRNQPPAPRPWWKRVWFKSKGE